MAAVFALSGIPLDAQATGCTGFASPDYSTVPNAIVGNLSGARIGSGFVVVVRDLFTHQPMPFAYVTIDFTGTGITLSSEQAADVVAEPGFCNLLTKRCDANGQVVFDPRFSGFANTDVVKVYGRADLNCGGLLLKTIKGRSTDLVTSSVASCGIRNESTSLADFTYFTARFGYGYFPECDFNNDGSLGLPDFAIFSPEFGVGPKHLCIP